MKNIVALDIETTGLDRIKDHIIQISMVKFNSETYEIIDTYDSYIKPIGHYIMSLPAYIKHKIRPEFLYDKPTIRDIAKDIIAFIGDCDILTYNGNNFDLPFLNNELKLVGEHIDFTSRKCYDAFLEERRRVPGDLDGVFTRYMGKSMKDAGLESHNSLADVSATIDIFRCQNDTAQVNADKVYGDSGMIKDMMFENELTPCLAYGKYKTLPLKLVQKVDDNYIKWLISEKSGIDKDTRQFVCEHLSYPH